MSSHDHPTETLADSNGDSGDQNRSFSTESIARGRKLGPYTVVEEVGRGGMGVVFLARDEALDRDVALKLIPPQFATDESKLKRFLREARSAAQLSHPGIVPIYFAGEEDGIAFIAMEYVDGQTLADSIRETLLPPVQAVRILRDVANALAHAHARGIVHRDVKPDNIMLAADGSVRITDFGLARSSVSARSNRITDTGIFIGTPVYSSPEQVQAGEVDGRSDLYSLGVVFYEMITGVTPFTAPSPYKLFHAILHDTPEPPNVVNPLVPEAVAGVVEKMMQRDKADRYQTAEEVVRDCEGLLRVLAGTAEVEPVPQTVRLPSATSTRLKAINVESRPAGPRRWMQLVAAAVVLVALAIGLVAGVELATHEPDTPRQPVVDRVEPADNTSQPVEPDTPAPPPRSRVLIQAFENLNHLPALDSFTVGVPAMLATSLSLADSGEHGFLQLVDRDEQRHAAAAAGLPDPDDPAAFADLVQATQVDAVIRGHFLVFDNTLCIDAWVHDVATGQRLGTSRVTGEEHEIYMMVDRLALALRAVLAENYAPDRMELPRPVANPDGQPNQSVVSADVPTARGNLVEAVLLPDETDVAGQVADEVREIFDKISRDLPVELSPRQGVVIRGDVVIPATASDTGTLDFDNLSVLPSRPEPQADLPAPTVLLPDGIGDLARRDRRAETEALAEELIAAAAELEASNSRLGGKDLAWANAPVGIRALLDRYERQSRQQQDGTLFTDMHDLLALLGESLDKLEARGPDGVPLRASLSNARLDAATAQGAMIEPPPVPDPAAFAGLSRDERRKLALATRYFMLGVTHLERARHWRSNGDSRRMAQDLHVALICLIRSLAEQPRFAPALDELRGIRKESWTVTANGE